MELLLLLLIMFRFIVQTQNFLLIDERRDTVLCYLGKKDDRAFSDWRWERPYRAFGDLYRHLAKIMSIPGLA